MDEKSLSENEITERAMEITKGLLLPEKSRKKYEKVYTNFMEWRATTNTTSFSENVFLVYFQELANKFKSSTLWAIYSMLRSTLNINNQIDISKYYKLVAFLRHKSEGFIGKKSKTFLTEEINTFINEAPDETYLLLKVTLIFGILGACRRQELYHLKYSNVEDLKNKILVKVTNTKTEKDRSFTIKGKYYKLCKKYMKLRPNPCTNPSFFLSYASGKCTTQSVGINKLGLLGKRIASYLNLPDPELYTGHCFHRTSATLLVDANGSIRSILRHGWKSTAEEVAEGRLQEQHLQPTRSLTESDGDASDVLLNETESNSDDDLSDYTSMYTEVPPSKAEGETAGKATSATTANSSGLHEGFRCTLCSGDIIGFRYTCVECADYDLCASCEAQGSHARHYVLRVPGPRPYAEVRAMVDRIRIEVLSVLQQTEVDDADRMKVEVKLEADPGPDPLPVVSISTAVSEPYVAFDSVSTEQKPWTILDTAVQEIKVEVESEDDETSMDIGDTVVISHTGQIIHHEQEAIVPHKKTKLREKRASATQKMTSATQKMTSATQKMSSANRKMTSASRKKPSATIMKKRSADPTKEGEQKMLEIEIDMGQIVRPATTSATEDTGGFTDSKMGTIPSLGGGERTTPSSPGKEETSAVTRRRIL